MKNLSMLLLLLFSFSGWAQDSTNYNVDGPDYQKEKKMDVYPAAILSRQPEFPKGTTALKKWCNVNSHFTKTMAKAGNSGKIYCEIMIDSVGKTGSPNILPVASARTSPLLVKETLRLASLLPDFVPGQYAGKNVTAKLILIFSYMADTTGKCSQMNRSGDIITIYPKKNN